MTDRKLDRDIFTEEFILFGQVEISEEEEKMIKSRFSHHLSCKVSPSLPGGGRDQVHMKVNQLNLGTIMFTRYTRYKGTKYT